MTGPSDIRGAECIVVFAKAAVEGRAKTRLAETIGDERAVELYTAFLEDVAERVADEREVDGSVVPVLAHAGRPEHESLRPFQRRNFRVVPQGEGDLGERIARVTERLFDEGARRILVVGSDSPTLQPRHFSAARRQLDGHDVVIGPSFDGGYWMMGFEEPTEALFEEIDWSTPRVFRQTLARAEEAGVLCRLLEFWYDIDTFADLRRLRTHVLDYLVDSDEVTPEQTARALRSADDAGLFDDASG